MGMCVNLFVEMNRLVGSCLVCLVKNKNQRRRKGSKKNGLPDVGDLGLTRLKNYQNNVDMKFILLVEFTRLSETVFRCRIILFQVLRYIFFKRRQKIVFRKLYDSVHGSMTVK